jgi:hypothetical protein
VLDLDPQLTLIREELRRTSELAAREAAVRIAEVWAWLEELGVLAEARFRLTLSGLEVPVEGVLPVWAIPALTGGLHVPSALLVRTAHLMRAIAPVVPAGVVAEFSEFGPAAVSVNWQGLPTYLQWTVELCQLPWPGVRVRGYAPAEEKPTALNQFRFYDAASVVEHFKSVVSGGAG